MWAALGDVDHYVEPFFGSGAVLLNRPHPANRTYYSETVNDYDGLVINAWRSIQLHPDATAEAASNPVAEADMHARHIALLRWRDNHELEHLMGDPAWCDPVMAGWWLWGISCWIGSGWCSGRGAWTADAEGRLYKQPRAANREPGVGRQLPHLSGNGQGVNHAGLREPGVGRQLPHLSDNGQGVNHAGLREPGVGRQLPHLSNNGQGVNRPQLREPGWWDGHDYHPVTMPKLREWFGFLSARLRHVRILNGDWARACTHGAINNLPVRHGGTAGIFLDPPYADTADRHEGLYAIDDLGIAHQVQEWCLANGDNPDYRIVLAGFDGEHGTSLTDNGWAETEWYTRDWLTGGMSNTNRSGATDQQHRERLWLSPHCTHTATTQEALF